jgi:outer membrane protein
MRLPIMAAFLLALFISTTATAEIIKIGYVDLQRAVMEVDEGAEANRKLKADFEKKQKILDQKKNEIQALQQELESQGLMMKPEVKQQKAGLLQKKMMEAQQVYVELQTDLSNKQVKVHGGILQKMQTILEAMGREYKLSLIIEKTEGSVLYAKSDMDYTNELIRRYNSAYGKKKK